MKSEIRQEQEKDHAAIYALVKDAFASAEHASGDEQNLVDRLRGSDASLPELALVAVVDGEVVGHIMFTKIDLGTTNSICLAPLAVAPAMQRKGVGGQLIEAGHALAKELGYEWSILVGHAAYYPQFGYTLASTYGIVCSFPVPDDCFMAYHLQGKEGFVGASVKLAKEFFEKSD